MKSSSETVDWVALRIGYIYYHRPLMYGGTAQGVDLILCLYHRFWAFIVQREHDLEAVWRDELAREDCGAANFAGRYAMNHPRATEEEIVRYVVEHWKRISANLGVPIPHEALEKEFPVK